MVKKLIFLFALLLTFGFCTKPKNNFSDTKFAILKNYEKMLLPDVFKNHKLKGCIRVFDEDSLKSELRSSYEKDVDLVTQAVGEGFISASWVWLRVIMRHPDWRHLKEKDFEVTYSRQKDCGSKNEPGLVMVNLVLSTEGIKQACAKYFEPGRNCRSFTYADERQIYSIDRDFMKLQRPLQGEKFENYKLSYVSLLVHEIGHDFGLGDTYCEHEYIEEKYINNQPPSVMNGNHSILLSPDDRRAIFTIWDLIQKNQMVCDEVKGSSITDDKGRMYCAPRK